MRATLEPANNMSAEELQPIAGNYGTGTLRKTLKIGVITPSGERCLLKYYVTKTLAENIEKLCAECGLQPAHLYALRPEGDDPLRPYVTEESRFELMENGKVFALTVSASAQARALVAELRCKKRRLRKDVFTDVLDVFADKKDSETGKKPSVKDLLERKAFVSAFSAAFNDAGGLDHVQERVESRSWKDTETLNDALACVLGVFNATDDAPLRVGFVQCVAALLPEERCIKDVHLYVRCLCVLRKAVLRGGEVASTVEQDLCIENLVECMNAGAKCLHVYVYALVNALLYFGDTRRLVARLQAASFWTLAQNDADDQSVWTSQLCHQLYVMQQNLINLMTERMNTPLATHMEREAVMLLDFYASATEALRITGTATAAERKYSTESLQRFGVTSANDLSDDFQETPPGLLTIDFMYRFAKNDFDSFSRILRQNNSWRRCRSCSFVRAATATARLVCELLRVGVEPQTHGSVFCGWFFARRLEVAVAEFFGECMRLFYRTWEQMSAKHDDFDKVLAAVREQVVAGLAARPMSADSFRKALPSYKLLQEKRFSRTVDFSAFPAAHELQMRVEAEVRSEVKQERKERLKAGHVFERLTMKRREAVAPSWFCRISRDGLHVQYQELSLQHKKPEGRMRTSESVQVADLVSHTTEEWTGKKDHTKFLLSLSFKDGTNLKIAANSLAQRQQWYEALAWDPSKPSGCQATEDECKKRLDMEMKLRLVNVEELLTHDAAPPLPPMPADYNFALENF